MFNVPLDTVLVISETIYFTGLTTQPTVSAVKALKEGG